MCVQHACLTDEEKIAVVAGKRPQTEASRVRIAWWTAIYGAAVMMEALIVSHGTHTVPLISFVRYAP